MFHVQIHNSTGSPAEKHYKNTDSSPCVQMNAEKNENVCLPENYVLSDSRIAVSESQSTQRCVGKTVTAESERQLHKLPVEFIDTR